jgi:hypothetical protein
MNVTRYLAAAAAMVVCGVGCRAGTVRVTGPATAAPSGTVTVSVALSPDMNNVYALQSALSYDASVLTPLPSQEATAAQGFHSGALAPFPGETIPKDADLFRMNTSQAGALVFGYVKNPSNPAGSPSTVVPATALKITFNVATTATGATTLQLNPYEVNGHAMPALIVGGIDGLPLDASVGAPLVIAFRLPGDVNGDLVVTLDDVAMALQLAGGLDASTGSSARNGDVWPSGAPDGVVTLRDAVQILRFVNGLDTALK